MSYPRRLAASLVATTLGATALALPGAAPARAAFSLFLAADAAAGSGARSAAYREGQQALDAGRWKEAAEIFARLAAEQGSDADAALYWQAYALSRQGREGEALAALRDLRARHPQSEWLDDGNALEVEMRGPRETVATANAEESEELKLFALSGLLQTDSARALPVLQKFLAGDASPRLKKQALFVLSQHDSAEARRLLAAIARGQSNPGLQAEAVGMLGVAGGADAVATLVAIYRESRDASVKRAVLQSLLVANAAGEVMAVARDDADPNLRRHAIHQLGAMNAGAELRELYARETTPELRRTILEAMGIAGDVEALAKVARTETDPALRRTAIHGLGITSSPAAAAALQQLYTTGGGEGVRPAVLDALFIQGNARALIAIFRQEKDAGLRREIVQKLSLMDSPEATELLMELLDN